MGETAVLGILAFDPLIIEKCPKVIGAVWKEWNSHRVEGGAQRCCSFSPASNFTCLKSLPP